MMAKRMFSRPKAKIRVTAAFWLERLRSMPEASRSMAPARARAETPGIYTTASCRSSQKITATASTAYNYSQRMCEKNAESEGVAVRCRFQRGDANKLDFPDGRFDAVVSNYVYHNITGADRQALLLETLRVLKKGGVFALNDEMKPRLYGDMEAFAQKLRDMGYEEVRLVDTAREIFGHRRAALMMLGASRLLVGRKQVK